MALFTQDVPLRARRRGSWPGLGVLLALVAWFGLAAGTEAGDNDTASTLATAYWPQMALVASTSADSDFTPMPVLQVSGTGRMLLAFNYLRGSVQNPYYSLYNRSAGTWSAPQPIYQHSTDFRYVTIAFDSTDRAHAVWRDEHDIFYAAENGWPSASKKLPSNGELIIDPPAMAIGPDNVIHVVWTQGNNLMRVYHAFSRDGGTSWTPSGAISQAGRDASAADVAVTADGAVHVVWEDYDLTDFSYRIYYRKAIRQGSGYSWSGNVSSLSSTLTGAMRPTLVAQGNSLHLGFANQKSQAEQYAYYRRFNAGGTWGSLVNVNPQKPVSVNTSNPYFLKMSLALCGGDVHVVYHGAGFSEVNEQIWHATSANNWQGVAAVTEPGTRFIHPSVACHSGVLSFGVEQVSGLGGAHDVYGVREEKRTLLPIVIGGS